MKILGLVMYVLSYPVMMASILSICLCARYFKDLFILNGIQFWQSLIVIFGSLIFVGGIGFGMYIFGCRKSLDLIPIFGNKEWETNIMLFIFLMVGVVSAVAYKAYKNRA